MEKYNEDIFGKLTNGSKEDASLWYKARHFVLNVLPPLDGNGIGRNSSKHVHVILENTEDIMLAVARQIALIAHYPNFDEDGGNNRTIITLCECPKLVTLTDAVDITYSKLMNLLKHCRSTYIDKSGTIEQVLNEGNILPLDIEFEFTSESQKDYVERKEKEDKKENKKQKYIPIIDEDIINAVDVEDIDVSKGMLVNMVYCVGTEINNLPSIDNANVSKYTAALNMFCYKLKVENVYEKWFDNEKKNDDGSYDYQSIANNLSSLFCADCFVSRLKSILDLKKKSLSEYLLEDFEEVMKKISKEENINAFAKSEHARWNVEKLIMGFRPFKSEERYKDETLFGNEKSDYRNRMKKGKEIPNEYIHVDLVSYRDLRRVHPENMKYDYFLMLAMPQILLSTIK